MIGFQPIGASSTLVAHIYGEVVKRYNVGLITQSCRFESDLRNFKLLGVAQFGSARALGARGRRFESCHLDRSNLELLQNERIYIMSNLKKYILALVIAFVITIPIASVILTIVFDTVIFLIISTIIYFIVMALVIKSFNYDKD